MKSDEWYHIHQEAVMPPYQFRKKLISVVAALGVLFMSASITDHMNEPEYLVTGDQAEQHTGL